MQATAVVPLPMKGSKTTPPQLTAVANNPLNDWQRLDGGVPIFLFVLVVDAAYLIRLCVLVTGRMRETARMEIQTILRVRQIFIEVCRQGVLLMPGQNLELTFQYTSIHPEVFRYLRFAAPEVGINLITLQSPDMLSKRHDVIAVSQICLVKIEERHVELLHIINAATC